MKDKSTVILAAILLAAIVGVGVWQLGGSSSSGSSGGGGRSAPTVGSTTLDGRPWRLADQKGKVVLLDFWASWCPPCLAALPELKELHERYRSEPDFVMVGVSLDHTREHLDRFLQRNPLPYTVLYEPPHQLANAFGVSGIPAIWIIGRDGKVVGGGHLSVSEADRLVRKALSAKPGA
jgi:thiol-disulfide isomerase/thioredoxin